MNYKCSPDNVKKRFLDELMRYDDDDDDFLYSSSHLNGSINGLDAQQIDQLEKNLGAINSPIKLKKSILIKNLDNIFSKIRFYDISNIIQPKDVGKLIDFSQNTDYPIDVKNRANSIISLMFCYPTEISSPLYQSGIFQQMITNYLDPIWLNGIAHYCCFSIQNRDQIFQFNIPKDIIEHLNSNEDKYNYSLGGVAKLARGLCSFPLSNIDQFQILLKLIFILVSSIQSVNIDVENIILSALFKFSTLDANCLNEFARFKIFALYASRPESFHPLNIKKLAILMTAVMNYSYDYAKYITNNENCWKIVLNYFENLIRCDSNLYKKCSIVISDASIIMANVSPSIFFDNSIYLHLISLYEVLQYEIKSQISMSFYAALEYATQEQILKVIENEEYRFVLSEYFPDVNHSKYILGAKGFLNLIFCLEANNKLNYIFELLQSDEIESSISKWYDGKEEIESIPEEKRNVFMLTITKISQFKNGED